MTSTFTVAVTMKERTDRPRVILATLPLSFSSPNQLSSFLETHYGPDSWADWRVVNEQAQTQILAEHGTAVATFDLPDMTDTPNGADVFAIHSPDPEVLAYAMAKYSRSSLSMKASLTEISSQKASEFLNTFYFQYGHKSIADMAHVPLAIEDISLLSAIEVVDEQRWDGQERSTRYQDFSKRLYYTPSGLDEVERVHYVYSINHLFDGYDQMFGQAYEQFREENPRPADMAEAAYERTLRARAFDVARYLLPMATLTSVGQITSARTLESQVSRMLASPYAEVRDIAERMKEATRQPAYNAVTGNADAPPPAATLVKYATENVFQSDVARYARARLADMKIVPPPGNRQALVETTLPTPSSTEVEIISTLLYEHSNLPFRTIWNHVGDMSGHWHAVFLREVFEQRPPHSELLRSFRATGGVIFDIHMDIGGMRDMHRHRRTTQITQPYNADDFAAPEPYLSNVDATYATWTQAARRSFNIMRVLREGKEGSLGPEAYLLPLGAKRRFLMKMDVAELAYIAELRTGPAGHISYRRVAWEMYQKLRFIAPNLAAGIERRVTDPDTPLDFFKR